jgi:hypothetical protein
MSLVQVQQEEPTQKPSSNAGLFLCLFATAIVTQALRNKCAPEGQAVASIPLIPSLSVTCLLFLA